MKSRCFIHVHKHELVELAVEGLDYSIIKKVDTQYLRGMDQLVDKVWQVACLKAEKVRSNKYHKKEKVAYIEVDEIENLSDIDCDYVEESKVNLAELKLEPPYVYKLLKPSNGKIMSSLKTNTKTCH